MIRFIAHFDGKNLSPDEPVELPTGTPLQVTVEQISQANAAGTFDLGKWFQEIEDRVGLVDDKPEDWALRHDHYLAEDACSDHRDE
jgi:hypothetical protein